MIEREGNVKKVIMRIDSENRVQLELMPWGGEDPVEVISHPSRFLPLGGRELWLTVRRGSPASNNHLTNVSSGLYIVYALG